jgi:hypothetical protein
MSDFHLLDEYLVVYRDGGRRHEAIRSELDRRFAQMERLRAIEAAARDAMRQIDRALWDTGFLHDLRNDARICNLRAALAAKEGGNGKA